MSHRTKLRILLGCLGCKIAVTASNDAQYSHVKHRTRVLSRELHITCPYVFIKRANEDNAFMDLRSWHHPILVLTTGTIRKSSSNELNATIGHELGHLKYSNNKYKRRSNDAFGFMIILLIICIGLFWLGDYKIQSILEWILLLGVAPTYSWILYNLQQQEYQADKVGARVTTRKDMIDSLLIFTDKLHINRSQRIPKWIRNITLTHPSIPDRIKALSTDPHILDKIVKITKYSRSQHIHNYLSKIHKLNREHGALNIKKHTERVQKGDD